MLLFYINDHYGVLFQVLFNNLKVDMTKIDPTSLLKDRSSEQQIVQKVTSSVNQDELPFADTGLSYKGAHVSQVC